MKPLLIKHKATKRSDNMFTPLKLGTNHMLGVDNFVPLVTNNFEVRIYNMDGSSPTEFSDLLTLSTAEIGEIVEEQDSIVVHYGNGLIKFPSKVNYADVTWTLNCYCEPNVLEALREWRKQIYDPATEKMGLPSQYMRQVYFLVTMDKVIFETPFVAPALGSLVFIMVLRIRKAEVLFKYP